MRRGWAAVMAALTVLVMFMAAGTARADGTIDAIKARGKLLAGVKYDTPPFGYLDDKNQVVGFDVDLMREIAKALGVEIELVKVTSPTRIPLLVSGNVDIVAASMTHTREREGTIDFSITYYTGAQALMVPTVESDQGARRSRRQDGRRSAGDDPREDPGTGGAAGEGAAVPRLHHRMAGASPRPRRRLHRELRHSARICQGDRRASTSSGTNSASSPSASASAMATGRCGTWSMPCCRISGPAAAIGEIYHQWFQVDPDIPIETLAQGLSRA